MSRITMGARVFGLIHLLTKGRVFMVGDILVIDGYHRVAQMVPINSAHFFWLSPSLGYFALDITVVEDEFGGSVRTIRTVNDLTQY